MSKNKQSMRVLIAEDVMRHLAAKKFFASHGDYVSWGYHDDEKLSPLVPNELLGPQIKELPPCHVCAKGAAFIVAVDRFNTLKAETFILDDEDEVVSELNDTSIHEYLYTLFDPKNIDAIEGAFEGWDRHQQRSYLGLVPIDEIFDFSALIKDKKQADIRLAMIMRNVIKNDGEFIPQQFIDEMNESGYDKDVLEPWLSDTKKKEEKDNE